MRLNRNILSGLGLSLVLLPAAPAFAWGKEGHRLTALVAEHYLTPETRAAIVELLHHETLADVSSWADDYRHDHPETGPWHYVNIPGDAPSFDRLRDCPSSATDPKSPWRDCATDRILYFEGELGDTTLPPQERATALKFLVHFIGDLHQPFHALGEARGGNDIAVTFLGSNQCGTYRCNLHGVWDESLIDHEGLSEKKHEELLLAEIDKNHWEHLAGGSPQLWADASHHYAQQAELPSGANITPAYVEEESKIVDAQLALGGLRLAHVLNRILGSPEPAQPDRQPLPKP
jgi:hypothetical protein